mgnify:FL=1
MKFLKLVVLILSFSFISACDESNKNIPAFANPDAPEYRALMFFDAIYNQKNLGEAQKYSTAKLSRILRSYGTTRGYARYVLNLPIDPGVDLQIDRSLNQVSTGQTDTTVVNILFTGTLNDERINDVRQAVFSRVDGEWLIDSGEDDPYMKR